jgi:hypothetical protein
VCILSYFQTDTIWKVYYTDGSVEPFSAESFASLLRNRLFRSQLLMVQAGLPPHEDEAVEKVDGFYSAKRQVSWVISMYDIV